ncbi:glycosyltransferase family 4 protein [uncultured Methanomethylovorans sp.]|uniref:glycosyltransferase family 4 protein n=1 Tax=uncultured Methanomethylovorans sp. TaxID=183759 RepID=UPI002AA80F3F|nr:glycosyltransferase family 4 protein [uncultured Methanomethylovorans sp.]
MKISIVVLKFPPKWLAGTEIATYNIAKKLVKKGHEVHVITMLDEGLPEYTLEEGFFIHRVPYAKFLFSRTLSMWFRFFLKIRSINPDIIHVQSIPLSVPAFFMRLISNKNYIIWVQGSDIYTPTAFLKLFSTPLLKKASTIIALTEGMKAEINNKCKTNIVVISNGIELENFKTELIGPSKLQNEGSLSTMDQKIIFVGTLRPIKGVRYLLEAMPIIRLNNSHVKLVIVGDGEEKEYLQKLTFDLNLNTCVSFVGKVPNDKIPKYMKDADLFVLPSLSESFGIVNIEAMASGLPIVSTNVGGLPYLIKDGINGFLVNPRDPAAIAEKSLLILNDMDLKEKLSQNNLIAAEKYSWDYVIERLVDEYNKVCFHHE